MLIIPCYKCYNLTLVVLAFYYNILLSARSSKSDSAPVRGEAYEPASLWTQQSQRKDVAQLRVGGRGGSRNVMGGSEKFSHGMVRSQKPLLTVPPS